jgi:hypothetical protein
MSLIVLGMAPRYFTMKQIGVKPPLALEKIPKKMF